VQKTMFRVATAQGLCEKIFRKKMLDTGFYSVCELQNSNLHRCVPEFMRVKFFLKN